MHLLSLGYSVTLHAIAPLQLKPLGQERHLLFETYFEESHFTGADSPLQVKPLGQIMHLLSLGYSVTLHLVAFLPSHEYPFGQSVQTPAEFLC